MDIEIDLRPVLRFLYCGTYPVAATVEDAMKNVKDMTELEKFWKYARDASFHYRDASHYADDTTKEWHLGDSAKGKALKIFDDNPDLQDEIRANFKELWRLER